GALWLLPEGSAASHWIGLLNPFRAMFAVLDPFAVQTGSEPIRVAAWDFLAVMAAVSLLINAVTLMRLRVWNPSRSVFFGTTLLDEEGASASLKARPGRAIWKQPILWREICTKAYGRKITVIKAAYVLVAVMIAMFIAR